MKTKVKSNAASAVSDDSRTALTAHPQHPEFLVVFQEPSERNVQTLADVLGLKETRGFQARSGVMCFDAKGPQQCVTRLYRRLGVAAADLDPQEIARVRGRKEVAFVVRNRVRSIPRPPVPHSLSNIGQPVESIPEALSESSSPIAAYLLGVRAAADAALRALGATEATPGINPTTHIGAARPSGLAWHLREVNVTKKTPTGRGIKVAVLDTGIDLQHPDFRGVFQEGVNAMSFVPNQSVQDGHGHGTHCAGLVAGPAKPKRGPRYGVAPGVELYIGKVLSNGGSGTDDQIIDGIDWAADRGVRIISMSLGSGRFDGEPYAEAYERVARNLLNADPGVLIIAAAGNESFRPFETQPVGNPAACPSMMAVAAVDAQRRIARFSSRSDSIAQVDVAAPGDSIYSSWSGGGYRLESGTSMATPIAAGIAAIHLQQSPAAMARKLWQTLIDSCVTLGAPVDFGAGIVQAP
jgi:subtilisin